MKIIKKIQIFGLTLAMLLPMFMCFAVPARAVDDPLVQAEAAILVETETGKLLYTKNEYDRRAPASLTKMMTALLAVEAYQNGEFSLDDVITVDDNAYYDLVGDYSTQNIRPGEEMTFGDVLYCALMASANEACNIIANYIAGDVATFIEMMNAKAAELGCTGTHFANTHGLPDDRHYSTAHDLYLIASAAMDMPLVAKIVSTDKYTVPQTNKSGERELVTTNRLLIKGTPYYYEYATGLKTGYTDAAGYCLASSATKGDMSLICIVLGAKSVVIEDGTTQIQSFSESKRLLQWGFTSFSYRVLLSTLRLVTEVPVEMGYGAESVVLRPSSDVVSLMDNSLDLNKVELDITLYNEQKGETLKAPIAIGEALGEVSVSLGGVCYGTVQLVANSSVDLHRMKFMQGEISKTLNSKYVKFTIVGLIAFLALYVLFVISYNSARKKKKAAADALARKRVEEIRRGENLTTGRSFEEIEALYRGDKKEPTRK